MVVNKERNTTLVAAARSALDVGIQEAVDTDLPSSVSDHQGSWNATTKEHITPTFIIEAIENRQNLFLKQNKTKKDRPLLSSKF